MALRGLSRTVNDTIQFSMNAVASPGQVVAYSNPTDSTSHNVARLSTSGIFYDGATEAQPVRPIGILMDQVIAAPTNSTTNVYALGGAGNSTVVSDTANAGMFMNPQGKRYVGEKVAIHREGLISTDQLFPGIFPSGGNLAYSASGGLIGDGTSVGAGQSGIVIGRFESPKDSDGYAAVYIDVDSAYLQYRHYGIHS